MGSSGSGMLTTILEVEVVLVLVLVLVVVFVLASSTSCSLLHRMPHRTRCCLLCWHSSEPVVEREREHGGRESEWHASVGSVACGVL